MPSRNPRSLFPVALMIILAALFLAWAQTSSTIPPSGLAGGGSAGVCPKATNTTCNAGGNLSGYDAHTTFTSAMAICTAQYNACVVSQNAETAQNEEICERVPNCWHQIGLVHTPSCSGTCSVVVEEEEGLVEYECPSSAMSSDPGDEDGVSDWSLCDSKPVSSGNDGMWSCSITGSVFMRDHCTFSYSDPGPRYSGGSGGGVTLPSGDDVWNIISKLSGN
ncbi:MAG: hypothetical protein V1776_02920 [Candidatus Diapherotrites archaeon]